MNLLDYTKKLAEKVKFYDSIADNNLWGLHTINPFAKPMNVTIIWIDDDSENK